MAQTEVRISNVPYMESLFKKYQRWISPRKIGISAALISLLLSMLRGIENFGIADGKGYVDQANGILKGPSYIFNNPSDFGHNLGFSLVIATTFIISHSTSLLLLKVLLAISHGAAVYLVAEIGKAIDLKDKYWMASSVFFAVDPFLLLGATSVGTENLTTLIVLYWCRLYLSHSAVGSSQKWKILFFILSGSFAITMRPNFLLPFIFISILLFIKWSQEGVQGPTLAFSVSIFVAFMSIYEIFLTRLNHAFVFLATYGGFGVAYACRTEFVKQYLGIASVSENQRINYWLNVENPLQATAIAKIHSLSPVQIDHEMMRLGVATCLDHPIRSLGVLGLKFFAIWRPFTVLGSYGFKVAIVSALILVPITVGTLLFLFRKNLLNPARSIRKFFLILCLGFVPSLLITTEQLRHRLAIAEPFFWLFSFAAIQYWVESTSLTNKNRRVKE